MVFEAVVKDVDRLVQSIWANKFQSIFKYGESECSII